MYTAQRTAQPDSYTIVHHLDTDVSGGKASGDILAKLAPALPVTPQPTDHERAEGCATSPGMAKFEACLKGLAREILRLGA